MFAQLTSATTLGVNAFAVQVEVDVSGGLPGMLIVGLPDAAVQESRERVRAAVRNAGLPFPASRIVVNLAPADVRKEGPMFDLPIALAVLLAQGVIPQSALDRTLVAGELALDGSLRPVRGAINLALYAAQAGVTRLLLPPASAPEAAAVGEIAVYAPAAAGLHCGGLVHAPPFRSPHHTVSDAGLIGGGSVPRPGEVSLAHRGVLFMDEFPEFSRRALEVLRQPLEDGVVTISRARAALTFPARFMLVAAQNPCPCGFYGDPQRSCSCAPGARQRYRERLSGPLLDRIDLRLSVPRLAPEELLRAPPGEPSARVRERVVAARTRALERQGVPNAELGGAALRRHAALGASAVAFAQTLAKQLGLSGRGFDRLLRVARTVADLAGASQLEEAHLAEAAAYRA